MCADIDDGSIVDDSGLLRRIHPDHVVQDENTKQLRPSSAAFRDKRMSVDSEQLLAAAGLDWHFSLRAHPQHSLVRFPASAARQCGQAIIVKPDPDQPDNPAHCEVVGKKGNPAVRTLKTNSAWVRLTPKTMAPS